MILENTKVNINAETLSARLKRLRGIKGLSIKAVANELGVSVSTYRDWEYGRLIKGEPYARIAAVLGVSLSELMSGEIRKNEKQIWVEFEKIRNHLANLERELRPLF